MNGRRLTRINRRIDRSREYARHRSWHRALRASERAVRMLGGRAADPSATGADGPLLARLFYEQAEMLHALGRHDAAVGAAETASYYYTRFDPTGGRPELVEEAVRRHRRSGAPTTGEFDARIGDAANARSWLAVLVARHGGRGEAARVDRLCEGALATHRELARVSPHYGADDVNRTVVQVSQARQLLLR